MIAVTRREMRVIDSLMDEVARLVPALREGRAFANAFDDDGDGPQIEPRDDAGTCPFLFGRGDRALCAIHATALDTGRSVAAVKPRACRHFPLVLERRGRGIGVTLHPAAERLGCIAPRETLPGQPTVRAAFAGEIAELRGLVAGRGSRR